MINVSLAGDLDSVPLGDDADVALDVALAVACSVVRIGQDCPLVVELGVCNITRSVSPSWSVLPHQVAASQSPRPV